MKKFEQAFIITGVACFEVPADNTPSLDGNEYPIHRIEFA